MPLLSQTASGASQTMDSQSSPIMQITTTKLLINYLNNVNNDLKSLITLYILRISKKNQQTSLQEAFSDRFTTSLHPVYSTILNVWRKTLWDIKRRRRQWKTISARHECTVSFLHNLVAADNRCRSSAVHLAVCWDKGSQFSLAGPHQPDPSPYWASH